MGAALKNVGIYNHRSCKPTAGISGIDSDCWYHEKG